MKSLPFFALLCLFVLLAACAPIESTQPQPVPQPVVAPEPVAKPEPAVVVPEPVPQPVVAPEPVAKPEPAVVVPEPVPQQEAPPAYSENVQLLIARTAKVKSMQYMYLAPGEISYGSTYHIKGNKTKIDLRRPYEIRDRAQYFDVVYIDNASAVGVGICTDLRDCPERFKRFDVQASNYRHPTPFDWLALLTADARVKGDQQYTNRAVKRVEFERDGTLVRFLMDEHYGLPLKVSFLDEDGIPVEIHEYRDFTANNLHTEDVTPPN